MAQTTTDFVIDTECHYKSNTPVLIQIYFITSHNVASPLVLVEIDFLPHYSSSLFLKFTDLFDCIFNSCSKIYSWGFISDELTPFLRYKLFSLPLPSMTYNTQGQFKSWFNQLIKNYYSSSDYHINTDLNDVVIIDAPVYDPTLILPTQLMNDKKVCSSESWGLQDAILYTFGQYLSKRETLRRWSIGLDSTLSTRDTSFSSNYRKRLINYACLECVSAAHINLIMQRSKIPLDIYYVKQEQQTSGEYNLSKNSPFVSNLFQLREDSSSSSEQYNPEMMTIHVPEERHPFQLSTIPIDYHNETTTIIPKNSFHSHTRSSIAKKKRNKKTSRRHRANSYKYETICSANMKIALIKKLLREKQPIFMWFAQHFALVSSHMVINVYMNSYCRQVCLFNYFLLFLFVYFSFLMLLYFLSVGEVLGSPSI